MRQHLAVFLCATASLAAVNTAQAQSAGASGSEPRATQLETIVVTARKRTESLQDVPVAVVAIPQAALQNNRADDLSKIGELAPQVTIGRATTGTGSVITIRGISSGAVDSGLDQSVSMSIDNVSLSRGRIIQTAMFDMQQVEILQGPQALFFGKNSPAGVISIHSADPTSAFEGYVRGGYEFKARERFVEGAVSGPLTDTLKGRVALHYNHMRGWIKNRAVPEANPFDPTAPLPGPLQGRWGPRETDFAGRMTLLWEPSDTFSANFKLTLDSHKVNGNGAWSEAFCVGGQTVPVVVAGATTVVMPNSDCRTDRVKAENSLPAKYAANYPYGNGGVPYQRSDLGLASLTLTKRLGDVTVTATTGYYDQFHRGAHIGDWSEFVRIYDSERERYQMLNQEIRANTEFDGPVNFMVGGYFEHSKRKWLNAPDLFNALNPLTNDYTSTITTSRSKNDSWSVFGQVRWELMPNLELAGGARYSKDIKRSLLLNVVNNPRGAIFASLFPAGVPINARYSDDNISPEATLTYHPQPGQTIYAAYKTGYKAGGISNGGLLSTGANAQNVQFGPEKVKGFEAGYKADLLDRTLRLNVVAYRYKYNGLQVTALDNNIFRYTIRNAASSRTTGVTADAEWLVSELLTLRGNIGYNKAVYLSFPNSQCYALQTAALGCVGGVQDLTGKRLNRAPKLTYMVGGDLHPELRPGWKTELSASAAYSGSYMTATDYGPGGFQKSYWRVNAAVHVGPENGPWTFSLIGRNLTNSYTKVTTFSWSATGNINQFAAIFSRPREVAAQLEYKF
jgi:outer membrane receptor protein involved in Fe transport